MLIHVSLVRRATDVHLVRPTHVVSVFAKNGLSFIKFTSRGVTMNFYCLNILIFNILKTLEHFV